VGKGLFCIPAIGQLALSSKINKWSYSRLEDRGQTSPKDGKMLKLVTCQSLEIDASLELGDLARHRGTTKDKVWSFTTAGSEQRPLISASRRPSGNHNQQSRPHKNLDTVNTCDNSPKSSWIRRSDCPTIQQPSDNKPRSGRLFHAQPLLKHLEKISGLGGSSYWSYLASKHIIKRHKCLECGVGLGGKVPRRGRTHQRMRSSD